MNMICKILFLLFLVLGFSSCGADKLNPKTTSSSQALTSPAQCACNASVGPPVCGSNLKDYANAACATNCGGGTSTVGHCDCAANEVQVCGADGLDHSECEAKENKIEIIKYVPCAAKEY